MIDVDHLVEVLEARNAIVLPRNYASPIKVSRHRAVENVLDQRRLAAARDTSHGDEESEGNLDIEIAQVVLARALDADHPIRIHPATHFGNRDLDFAAQVSPRDRLGVGPHFVDSSFSDDESAVLSGSRTEIDQVIGGLHRLLVMLDDDDSVAEVAQLTERVEQPGVVALVQTDRRLVEDV